MIAIEFLNLALINIQIIDYRECYSVDSPEDILLVEKVLKKCKATSCLRKNISYKSRDISDYFSKNRISFDSFYEFEKDILSSVDWFDGISVLDVGCGCGGLGLALNKKFGVFDYTGIDIHSESPKIAKETNAIVGFSLKNNDFMKFDGGQRNFDVVTSLSCVD